VTLLLLGLSENNYRFWWVTLGLGVVIIGAVIILLTLLTSFVKDIDENVLDVWETATRVAANTATTWMLTQTGNSVHALADEVNRHVELLDSVGDRQ